MSSLNERLTEVLNTSSSMEYNQMLCINNAEIWLLIHLFLKILTEMFVGTAISPIAIVLTLCAYRWIHLRNGILGRFLPDSDEEYSGFTCLKDEMKLMFIYTYLAFLYTWLKLTDTNYTVTPMNFLRWLIEATNIPFSIAGAIALPFGRFSSNFLTFQESYHVNAPLTKTALFIVMRYTESQPDFVLNNIQMLVFNKLCHRVSK